MNKAIPLLVAAGVAALAIVLVKKDGGNVVRVNLIGGQHTQFYYDGRPITGKELLSSVKDYLIIAYYWREAYGVWDDITASTMIVSRDFISVKVSEDCVLEYKP